MADSHSVVTHDNWFSRVGKSIGGVFAGLLLIILAVALLFWNEGRAVKTYKSLVEGEGVVVPIDAGEVDPGNDGKLVHFSGRPDAGGDLIDEEFEVSAPALRLRRDVSMYQWEEKEESKTEKKLGGGEETVTTFTYSKAWLGSPANSDQFHDPEGHENPGEFPFESIIWDAEEVEVGAFLLPHSLIRQLDDFEKLSLGELPDSIDWPDDARIDKGRIYFGDDPARPEIGDLRVEFSVVAPDSVSVVARQTGHTLGPYRTKAGGDIAMIRPGTLSAMEMFEAAHADNATLTWLLRLAGFVMIWFGFLLVFAPLSVLADIVPLFGNLVGMATGLVTLLLALAVSLVVIALAWLVFRPLLGIILLLAAAGALYFVIKALQRRRKPAAS